MNVGFVSVDQVSCPSGFPFLDHGQERYFLFRFYHRKCRLSPSLCVPKHHIRLSSFPFLPFGIQFPHLHSLCADLRELGLPSAVRPGLNLSFDGTPIFLSSFPLFWPDGGGDGVPGEIFPFFQLPSAGGGIFFSSPTEPFSFLKKEVFFPF